MAIEKDEAIILRRFPFRETSLLVTLFTQSHGKVKVLIKGVRGQKRPPGVVYEPFTHLHMVYYEKTRSDIHLLSQAFVRSTNAHLKESLAAYSLASYCLDLTDALFGPHDTHPDVFDLLLEVFSALDGKVDPLLARAVEFKMLHAVGSLPIVSQCAACGKKPLDVVYFSPRQGGLICAVCDKRELRTIPIQSETRHMLEHITRSSISSIQGLDLKEQVLGELERMSTTFLQYRLERRLKAKSFLSEVELLLKARLPG